MDEVWYDDPDEEALSQQSLSDGIERERYALIDLQVAQDEEEYAAQPKTPLSPELTRLALSSESMALERLEVGARTVHDFQVVRKVWNRMDANRERRERYREITRGNTIPLEYGRTHDGLIFPRILMEPANRQLCRGNFLDVLNDCPYEMQELMADAFLSRIVDELKPEHKEILHGLYLRLEKSKTLAAQRGQTDRNIRKVRDTAQRKLQARLYRHLTFKKERNLSLTNREKEFLLRYDAQELDERDSRS